MNQGCLSATDLNCLKLCEHFLYLSLPFFPSSLQLHPPSHPFVQRPGIFHHLKSLSVFSVGVRRGEGTVMVQVGGWRWDGILFADGAGVGAVVGLGLRSG